MLDDEFINWNGCRVRADSLIWGGVPIPESASTQHFVAIGSAGSGKSITLRLLMQLVLPLIGRRPNVRALIYDAKRDAFPILHGMGVKCPIHILNPLDARSVAWDTAKDITDFASAHEFARLLIPIPKETKEPFFLQAAAAIMESVVAAFILDRREDWTLRDVLLAVSSQKDLAILLSRHRELRETLDDYVMAKEYPGIRSTLRNTLGKLKIIAACWHRAKDRISLREWLRKDEILLLGRHSLFGETLDTVNRLLMTRLTQLLDSQADNRSDAKYPQRSWVIFDELPSAGNLDTLPTLFTEGRSKGVCGVIAFQSIKHMRKSFGEEMASAIIGQCSHAAFLRLATDPDTAEWAAKFFGEKVVKEGFKDISTTETEGWTDGKKSTSKSRQESNRINIQKRDVLLPNELTNMPPCGEGHGLSGYYYSSLHGFYTSTYPSQMLFGKNNPDRILCGKPELPMGFVERPPEHQQLLEWTPEERRKFRLDSNSLDDLGRFSSDEE